MNTTTMGKHIDTIPAAAEKIPAGLTERQVYNRLKKYAELDAIAKAAKAEMDALRADIMRDAESLVIDCNLFSLDAGKEAYSSFDSKAFKAAHADLYAEFTRAGTRSKFRFKFK